MVVAKVITNKMAENDLPNEVVFIVEISAVSQLGSEVASCTTVRESRILGAWHYRRTVGLRPSRHLFEDNFGNTPARSYPAKTSIPRNAAHLSEPPQFLDE